MFLIRLYGWGTDFWKTKYGTLCREIYIDKKFPVRDINSRMNIDKIE
jgi:hypothetical protein